MSVLVTGGAGYIGSHMVLELLEAGEDVIFLDDLSTGLRSSVPGPVRFVQGNAGDASLVDRLLSDTPIDAILHFAGSIVVPDSVADPLSYYANNVCNTRNLLACAVKAGVPNFVFSSTAAVYGEPDRSPAAEDAPLRPISPYGSSKLMTETMLADTARAHAFRYVALRYFNVAGADPKGRTGQSTPRATHLIKVACEAAIGLRPGLEIYGTDYPTPDGTCVRDYIHVTDLVRAHLDALRYLRGGAGSVVLNCGYGQGFSVLEVLDAVKRVSGRDFPTQTVSRRLGDPPELVAGAERIREVLHWQPRLNDLDTIVGHALAWERHLKTQRDTG